VFHVSSVENNKGGLQQYTLYLQLLK